jgi:hypothetical protein
MMRSPKTEDLINSETNQIYINIKHDHCSLKESCHSIISQREALVALCRLQHELIETVVRDLTIRDPKISKNLSESHKLYDLISNALRH